MKKQVLAVSAVLGIAAIALSAGTLAYFTDRTDAKTNTFTVGKVNIELNEAEEADWGIDETTNEPKTKLMPGGVYSKTPVITVEDDSEDAYIFATITLDHARDFITAVLNLRNNPDEAAAVIGEGVDTSDVEALFMALLPKFVGGFDTNNWEIVNAKMEDNAVTFIVADKTGPHSAGESVTLFESIKLPEELTENTFKNTNFDGATITVMAGAIQAEGFDDYVAAGNALAVQWGMN
ncbi:SipW-dependent-type signal peptide-containing protein [Candidatus Saccharibacteria bacterium]|nr:SipW-dependent-type signal peptide-containing protein [Candidatus Saccharibacteria bacterium]